MTSYNEIFIYGTDMSQSLSSFHFGESLNKMAERENGIGPSSDQRNADPSTNNNGFSSNSAYWTQYWQHYYYTYSFYYYSSYYNYYLQCQAQGQAINLQFSLPSAGQATGNGPQNLPQVINGGVNRSNTGQQPVGQQTTQPARYEFKIASIGKRVLAEFIDFVFLFFIKYLLYSLYYDEPGQLSQIQYILVVDETTNLKELEEVLIQALVYRLIVFLYEAFFTAIPFPCPIGGATLGKYMMGITVISYRGLTPVTGQNLQRFLGNVPQRLQPWQACVRAVLKNFMVTFFFPIMFTAMFLQNYRTPYDFIASSIVVEAHPKPERQT